MKIKAIFVLSVLNLTLEQDLEEIWMRLKQEINLDKKSESGSGFVSVTILLPTTYGEMSLTRGIRCHSCSLVYWHPYTADMFSHYSFIKARMKGVNPRHIDYTNCFFIPFHTSISYPSRKFQSRVIPSRATRSGQVTLPHFFF